MSNNSVNEIEDRSKEIREEIKEILSLEYIAKHMSMVDELDEAGYLPIEKLLAFPQILQLNANFEELQKAILSVDGLEISPDQQLVRLSIPIERKTIIIRDTPANTTEEDIRALLQSYPSALIKKEVGNTWFITLEDEKSVLECIKTLQTQILHNEPIRARVKSEFYKKELLHRLNSLQEEERPQRKLSSAATPFTPSMFWGTMGMNGIDFGYSQVYSPIPPNIPLVITASEKTGYNEDYLHYSREDLYLIVKDLKDISCPPVPDELIESGIVLKEANCELVEKGRTMSIDQALQSGAPRSFSIDSVDYTNMVGGYMGDEVTAHLKKQRRHKKHS